MPRISSIKKVNIATASFPVALNLKSAVNRYKFYGTKTLSGNLAITASGTPSDGMEVHIDWNCTVTALTHSISVFGTAIPGAFLSKRLQILCTYNNSAWDIFMLPSIDWWTGSQGSVIIIGAGGGIEPLDAKTSGYFLFGDGTGLTSSPIIGDITVTGGGVSAIGTDKVNADMVKDGDLTNAHLNAAAAIVFTKMAALTASKIPVLNASGFIEAGSVDASKLSYLNVTTPGTAEASKAVVLDASKKISDIDITTLKLGGTTVTATAAQVNYLANVTSDVQAQIDASVSKNSYGEISADTTATAGTLKNVYIADTSGGAVDLTLPDGATLDIGTTVKLLRIGANAASLVPDGSDKIYPVTSYTVDAASVACSGTGKSITAVLKSATEWQIVQAD